MNRIFAAATIVGVSAALFPAGLPAQTQAAPAAAAAAPARVPAKAAQHAKPRSWSRADARVCLEFPTNLQVIKCSEKYRYMKVPA